MIAQVTKDTTNPTRNSAKALLCSKNLLLAQLGACNRDVDSCEFSLPGSFSSIIKHPHSAWHLKLDFFTTTDFGSQILAEEKSGVNVEHAELTASKRLPMHTERQLNKPVKPQNLALQD